MSPHSSISMKTHSPEHLWHKTKQFIIIMRTRNKRNLSHNHLYAVVGGHRIVKRSLRESSGVDNEFEF